MRRTGITLLALVALSAPTHAADLGGWTAPATSSPIMSGVTATQWSGFYAGLAGGYGFGTTTVSPALPGGAVDNNSGGWTLGATAGYNMDMGGFVLGVEGDLQWGNIGYSEPVAGGTFTARTDMFGTLRARAGVPIGQVMPYATLGGAFGRGTAQVDTGVLTSQTVNHFGWTAGVGIEAQATGNLTIKAEYLYTDLGSATYTGLPGGARDIGQSFSVIRAGVNYRF